MEEPTAQERPFSGEKSHLHHATDSCEAVVDSLRLEARLFGEFSGRLLIEKIPLYKSDNGGESWVQWGYIGLAGQLFSKVEIMCFDGQIGGSSTQEAYLLVFYTFEGGWLRLAKSEMASQNFTFQTVVGSSGSGYPTDFAVDRNNSGTNYRAICLYDSLNVVKCIRSEPSSYGTVWQDAHSLGFLARDIDFCYGWNGAIYASYNGFNSGNLYARENTNYGDPTSWETHVTVIDGATDTTRHRQIIASREDDPNNIVALVFEKRAGSTYDLYWAIKPSGGSWATMQGWVLPEENKWPALYSRKTESNQIFRSVFERSGTGKYFYFLYHATLLYSLILQQYA